MDSTQLLELTIRRYDAEHSRKEGLDASLTAPIAAFSALFAGNLYLSSALTSKSSCLTWVFTVLTVLATITAAVLLLRSFWLHEYNYVPLPLRLEKWRMERLSWSVAMEGYRAKYPEMAKSMPPELSVDEAYKEHLIQAFGKAAADCFISNNRRAWFRVWGIGGTVCGFLLLAITLVLVKALDGR